MLRRRISLERRDRTGCEETCSTQCQLGWRNRAELIRHARIHADIVQLIEELRDAGLALYVISSEFEELVAYSDRVSVMRDRRQVAVLEREDLSLESIVSVIAAPASDK